MPTSTVKLAVLATIRDLDIEVHCERCRGALGRYSAGLRYPERDIVVISERGATFRTSDPKAISHKIGTKGPRTQPGLYPEEFDGVVYMRKRCTCGANEKRRRDALGELPVTIRADGAVTLLV